MIESQLPELQPVTYTPGSAADAGDGSAPPATPMHPDVGVIALVIDRWGSQWTSRHQVLTRLARYFHVTWLNPAPEWRAALAHGVHGAREERVAGQPPAFVVRDAATWHATVYRPAWLSRATLRLRLRAARRRLAARGCRRFVLYVWHVAHAPALDAVEHDFSIYHIYDEYSHAEVEPPLDPVEERLIRRVGGLITLSPPMFMRKGGLNPRSVRIPNGVEYDAFATPVPEPADLAAIPHPRVGYAGFLKKQLDWELLLALARRRPEWSFVLVGGMRPHPEITALVETMRALPNVHFLGAKPTAELARYPQHFDVCLMPYRRNDYTKYISPLKLHEYLASGRPVVSVPIPALADVEGLVSIASGAEEWDAALSRELEPRADAPACRARRQEEARRHDWSGIAERIATLIVSGLERPAGE